jgi:hypothetical protein
MDDAAEDGGAEVRSLLIRRHLGLLAQWDAAGGDPFGGVLKGKVDMNKVVLVGHSRGGEGVNRAAVDALVSDPYKIVGVVSYGPTGESGLFFFASCSLFLSLSFLPA